MKLAVCTVTIGAAMEPLAALTHPTLRRYAQRIGADFVVIDRRAYPDRVPVAYEKLRVGELLGRYDRVVCLDTDLIVRADTPSLFDVVAEHDFGALNERPWFDFDSAGVIADVCRQLRVPVPRFDWERRHFQTGVLVASRRHAPVFALPRLYFADHPWEQTWINVRLAALGVSIHELPYRYNRVGCMDRRLAEPRAASYVIHYAGTGGRTRYGYRHALAPGESVLDLVRRDLAAWGEGGAAC